MRAYLMTIVKGREAVEDCLQETALVVWEKFDPNWNEEDFRRFSFRCARYKALNWIKKHESRGMVFMDPEVARRVCERVESLSIQERRSDGRVEAIEACIEGMPQRQRALLDARYASSGCEDLARFADETGTTMAALYKQLERLRTALRKCVQTRLGQHE
ncbi:hypothetical protein HAHE_18940 [Haloferula helveola]|uniref:RNA polymerase sigma-70 region 2 domain-containing protein n=1 Tax=Haloferula helveola TaxID=490095 RepID=A0ABM7R9P3_9BACT|nr:hypothetical protein HAHE_18940 [Haloferula helveola]